MSLKLRLLTGLRTRRYDPLARTEWSDPYGLRPIIANGKAGDDLAAEGIERDPNRGVWQRYAPSFAEYRSECETIYFVNHAVWDLKPWGTGVTGPAQPGPRMQEIARQRGD